MVIQVQLMESWYMFEFSQMLKLCILPMQIVEYIVDDSQSLISLSDSDSDSDEGSISKLWAYPRNINKTSF